MLGMLLGVDEPLFVHFALGFLRLRTYFNFGEGF
jgi:hypothetical protein